MNCVVRNSVLFVAIFLFSAGAPKVYAKEYAKDSQDMNAPAASKIITLPAFPEKGRQFEIRRRGWLVGNAESYR